MSDYTLQPIPYISFDGNCAEALDYYAAVFGGKIFSKSTFGEIPGGDQFPEEAKNKIVNAQLELPGGMFLYGGDSAPSFHRSIMI